MRAIASDFRVLTAAALLGAFGVSSVGADESREPGTAEIAALIEQLGDADYARRETAAARLDAIGASAIDSLLTAAESSDDLEVALRAHWLAESIPLAAPDDTPDVVKLIGRYQRKTFGDRVRIMHRLLRVDDDAGVAALARIVRLDRDPTAARFGAAILAREWIPGDPYWPGMAERILAGLGASTRPAAHFLRTVVEFSRAESAADRTRLADAARDALAALDLGGTGQGGDRLVGGLAGELTAEIGETTHSIFTRCFVRMLVEAGRRDEAAALVRGTLAESIARAAAPDQETDAGVGEVADVLIWSAANGIPEVVDGLTGAEANAVRDHAVVQYAAAICERTRQRGAEADRLAEAAHQSAGAETTRRLQAAVLLVKWGAHDWADRAYRAVLDDEATPTSQRVLASVWYSEHLHDLGREAEAAAVLRKIVERSQEDHAIPAILQQIGHDPLATRARMHYFDACAAAARGDSTAQRASLMEATSTVAKDVDALIALYRLPDNTPEQKTRVMKLIKEALDRIEGGIEAVPDDANSYNEYAWLVANTEGDVAKATRYSKRSLAISIDSSSYLDTLAHCHAAAKHYPLAIRTQRLALRQQPHGRILKVNLETFERLAAAAP